MKKNSVKSANFTSKTSGKSVISSAEFFEDITSDRLHGSSQLYTKFLSLFKTYIQQLEKVSSDSIKCLANDVIAVRNDMAPFYYVALRISELQKDLSGSSESIKKVLLDLITSLEQEYSAAVSKITKNMTSQFAKPKSVMLHSNSGTVTCVIREVFDKKVKLFLSDAQPDCEGAKLGEELCGMGFEVVLFPDDAKALYVPRVDMVLLGTDWVAEKDFTNKIGSHCLALAAVNENKPVVVVTDGSKLVPGRFRVQRDVHQIKLGKTLRRETPLFEEVDNQLVDSFVTDLGVFQSGEIGAFVETRLKYVNFCVE